MISYCTCPCSALLPHVICDCQSVHSINQLTCKTLSPLCPEWQILPKANARVQDGLQEALSCSVRDLVVGLSLARLKPGISHLDILKKSACPWIQAVNPLLWH